MEIKIIAVGKLKEKYWTDATTEYLKRLRPYYKVSVEEIKESITSQNCSDAEERVGREKEGEDILKRISDTDLVVTLEIGGKMLDSLELAQLVEAWALAGRQRIVMVIGGSTGLGDNVINRSDFALSFSKMTFPHQMMRVVLLEQIYRAGKINRGERYHK